MTNEAKRNENTVEPLVRHCFICSNISRKPKGFIWRGSQSPAPESRKFPTCPTDKWLFRPAGYFIGLKAKTS